MKWFHHDAAATSDPRMQALAAAHGPAGIGVYWEIIENIAFHSDTFRLKVLDVSKQADSTYAAECAQQNGSDKGFNGYPREPEKIPVFRLEILAKILHTRRRKLLWIIRTCIREGLFDEESWTRQAVIYSPDLEKGADTYTRRMKRRQERGNGEPAPREDRVRTLCEQPAEHIRTKFDKVPPEQDTEGERDKNNNPLGDVVKKIVQSLNLSPFHGKGMKDRAPAPFNLTTGQFEEYSKKLRKTLLEWNCRHERRFEWDPTVRELRVLFYGGTAAEKERIAYESMNVLDGMLSYPEVVLRAVRMMLKADEATPVKNPMAWLYACLHGNGRGKGPWVHLPEAGEEH